MGTTLNNGITYTYNREEMIEKIRMVGEKLAKINNCYDKRQTI